MKQTFITSLALGSVLALGAASASAAENPFGATSLQQGYQLAENTAGEEKGAEGKCGEGKKCEGKCGEGKCGEGKTCDGKHKEGKCAADKKGKEGACGHG